MPEGIPRWLDPRIWIFVLAVGLLGLAASLVWKASKIASSGSQPPHVAGTIIPPADSSSGAVVLPADGFTGPITHRAPTDGFERDSLDVPEPPDFEDKVQDGFSKEGELRQGEAKADRFLLEGSVDAYVFVAYPAGDLELELTSPSGHVYGPGQPSSPHLRYEKTEEGLFGLFRGHAAYFGIEKAEAGLWKARVIAKAVPDTMPKIPYLLGSLIARGGLRGIAIRDLTKAHTYHIGESATLVASVHEGTDPVRDCYVTGYVPLNPDHPTPVPMHDDGRLPTRPRETASTAGSPPSSRAPTKCITRSARRGSLRSTGQDSTTRWAACSA
jgi:hypothetical protein